MPYGVYPPREAVEAQFTPAQRKVCTGAAGTLILADTSGLHRGGHAAQRPRLLFHAIYASDGVAPALKTPNYRCASELYTAVGAIARHAIGSPARD
jgi:hypothetical protein